MTAVTNTTPLRIGMSLTHELELGRHRQNRNGIGNVKLHGVVNLFNDCGDVSVVVVGTFRGALIMSDALEIKPNSVHITTVHYYCVFFGFYASNVTTKAQKVLRQNTSV